MVRRKIRLIEVDEDKGVFIQPCSCGGKVLYYTDQGVRCSTCGKLYGIWSNRKRTIIERVMNLFTEASGQKEEDEEDIPTMNIVIEQE